MPITKHNFIVKDVEKLADTIRKAFRIARSGRPGPVLIDIPKDVTAKVTEYFPKAVEFPPRKTETITEEALVRALEMIEASKKPFLYVGGGVILSGASQKLREYKKSRCTGDRYPDGKRCFSGNGSPLYGYDWNAWYQDVQLRGE